MNVLDSPKSKKPANLVNLQVFAFFKLVIAEEEDPERLRNLMNGNTLSRAKELLTNFMSAKSLSLGFPL
ncbi:MAG: hypothetical protein DI539_23490 [Flavobacterium psychrophilum]|jgi:hypothetical protein|nr:MAG: hypothetical protein DI539_23490 [Flavobacterium psychrophilum]